MSQTYVNLSNEPIRLGPKIGSGGEGDVFEVEGCPNWVAKIYRPGCAPPSPDKLFCAIGCATSELFKVAAWPFSTLHETRSTDPIVGFLMPRIVGHDSLHNLYRLEDRLAKYPEADWRLLTDAALNCATVFEVIHRSGILVGDVNQRNTLVAPNGHIALVDCDSFQVCSPYGRVFRCTVGVDEFTPPELQGKKPQDFDRVENHDRFGLAVLIFQMLLFRDPYAGRNFDGTTPNPAQSIQENRFAYTRNKNLAQSEPPLGAPTLEVLPFSLAVLFERAFSPPLPGHERPSASEWRIALQEFRDQLVPCGTYRTHWYHPISVTCPWCELAARHKPAWFNELPVLLPPPIILPSVPPPVVAPLPAPPPPADADISGLISIVGLFAITFLLLGALVVVFGRKAPEKRSDPVSALTKALAPAPPVAPSPTELLLLNEIRSEPNEVIRRQVVALGVLRAKNPNWLASEDCERTVRQLADQLRRARPRTGVVPHGSDPSPSKVARVLGLLGPAARSATPALIEALTYNDELDRAREREALQQIDPDWAASAEAKQCIPALFAIWDDTQDPMVRASAAQVMGAIERDWFMKRVQLPARRKFEANERQRK